MAQGIVADNWSLQDIASLFVDGLDSGNSDEIVIRNNEHIYQPVASAGIQTEALFDLLTDIILRDEIIVEEKFTTAWERHESPLQSLKKLGILRDYPFLNDPQKLVTPRDAIISRLCVTESLKNDHQENVETWSRNHQTPHALLSATLWGGAGMLARSFVYDRSYTPHPLRRKLFLNSNFLLPATDAVHRLNSLINEKRLSVSKRIYGSDALYSMFVNLPPIPIRVIQESGSSSDIIKCALQVRDEFKELREWLSSFQNALFTDNHKSVAEHSNVLESVAKNIDERLGIYTTNQFGLSAGLGILRININSDLINQTRNRFGVRATLNKLILDKSGREALKKYASFFGERDTSVGVNLEHYFSVAS